MMLCRTLVRSACRRTTRQSQLQHARQRRVWFSASTGYKTHKTVSVDAVMTDNSTKRFYKHVDVLPIGDGFGVLVGGRVLTTPAKIAVSVPSELLACAIAQEWDKQQKFIKPHSMPMMHLTTIALDQIPKLRPGIIAGIQNKARWDATVLRADSPSALVRVQNKHFKPILGWLESNYDIKLESQAGIAGVAHDEAALIKLQALVDSLDNWQLAAVDNLASITSSITIPLALAARQLTADQAFEAARVDENFQIRQFGKVDGIYGHGTDIEYHRQKINAAASFLQLLSPM